MNFTCDFDREATYSDITWDFDRKATYSSLTRDFDWEATFSDLKWYFILSYHFYSFYSERSFLIFSILILFM